MKKLTAGIFTVLMGLVSVNAADAAVASKGYVDKQINTQKAAYELADSQTLGAAEAYTNRKTGDVGSLAADTTLKYVNGVADLTAAVKKLDAAVSVASGDLTNVYTKGDADDKFIDTTEIQGYATDDELTAVSDVANAADTLSKSNKESIDAIKSETTGILKQAKDYTDAEVKELAEGAVATNTANIATLNGADTVDGSVKKQIKDASDATKVAYEAADAAALVTAQGYADAAESAAKTYAKTYTDQKVAGLNLAEISRVPAACGTPGNYCTLTTNGTNFVWEVIARGDAADEEAPSDAAGSSRLQVTVPVVTEPAVTQ